MEQYQPRILEAGCTCDAVYWFQILLQTLI